MTKARTRKKLAAAPPPDRHPPHSIEAEQSVIGGLLLNNRAFAEVADRITADDFYAQGHRVLFEHIGELIRGGVSCDFVTLSEHLRSKDLLNAAGGLAYLGTLAADTPSAANVLAYADIVRERSLLRQMIAAGVEISDLGYKPGGQDFSVLLDRVRHRVAQLAVKAERAEDTAWQDQLMRNKEDRVMATLSNLVIILDKHPAWRDRLRLDVRSHRIICRDLPTGEGTREIDEADKVEIAAWMGRIDTMAVNVDTRKVGEATLCVASRRKFNPLVEWLDSIKWDENERIPTFFSKYCSSAQNDYTATVAQNFFIGAVARARDPGAKFDLMLILEGPQGARKTSLLIELATPEWYAEAMESPAVKDFYQSLQGKWIIEIAELESFSKAEVNKIKQAITSRWDYYRPSYGEFAKNFPRCCVFAGTTNESTYLRDPTGARRFMPVKVGEIDLEGIRAIRTQLWAEADALYRRGVAFWKLPPAAEAEQESRYQEDSWSEVVKRWLDGEAPKGTYPNEIPVKVTEVTMTEVLRRALLLDFGKHDRATQTRVGMIMKRMGWERKQRGDGSWYYRRPEEDGSGA
ncbi:MAG TPA: VapE domain-containing protein [Nevskia sp.]|nr:VapE domain-containing protein [Nevskia sp.]